MLQNNFVTRPSSLTALIDEYLKVVAALKFHVEEQIELGFVGSPRTLHPSSATDHSFSSMEDVRIAVENCRACPLHESRTNAVFGAGNEKARLVFVGEAPGADEDQQGQPFVGRAGQKLTQIIEAMGLSRPEVYITNVLKCRPPGNRNPLPEEVRACEPYLIEQLRLIKPKIVCALGTFAAQTLLRTDRRISSLRGRFHTYQGIKLMPTYHPAYILRNPGSKRDVWEDVKKIKAEYDRE
jgi:uracil-DNA glycosylase family 4